MNKVSEVAGLHLSPHDLRRTFTTIGIANCGIDLFKVELLTNHVPKTVTERHYLETQQLQYLLPAPIQLPWKSTEFHKRLSAKDFSLDNDPVRSTEIHPLLD